MREHRLVIIGSSREFEQLVFTAKKRGYYTIVCDGYPEGPAKILADKAYTIDIRSTDSIAQMCIEEKADGIIGSFSDVIFEQITKIADKAKLRWYISPDKIKYYRDKYISKEVLNKMDIKMVTPRSAVLGENFSNYDIAGLTFPLVAKPINSYGSKGIAVVHNIKELHEQYETVRKWNYDDNRNIIVEEFCYGEEYNMMCFVAKGVVYPISIADREKNPQIGNTVPLLNRIVYPALKAKEVLNKAIAILQNFVDYTGQTEGPIAMQFFYNNNGIKVCEIAGRLFGYEHEMVTYCSGFSIENLLLDYVYCPENVENALKHHTPYFDKCVAGLYFIGKQGEQIQNQEKAKSLADCECVLDSQLFYQNGEKVNNFGRNPYLIRYYIKGDSREIVDMTTEYFFENIKILNEKGTNIVYPCIMEHRNLYSSSFGK